MFRLSFSLVLLVLAMLLPAVVPVACGSPAKVELPRPENSELSQGRSPAEALAAWPFRRRGGRRGGGRSCAGGLCSYDPPGSVSTVS